MHSFDHKPMLHSLVCHLTGLQLAKMQQLSQRLWIDTAAVSHCGNVSAFMYIEEIEKNWLLLSRAGGCDSAMYAMTPDDTLSDVPCLCDMGTLGSNI